MPRLPAPASIPDQFFTWTPRVLAIIYILFISIFALDEFGQGVEFWKATLGFAMHLIPSLLLVLFLIISWRWAKIGAVLFLVASIAVTIVFQTYRNITSFVFISISLFVIGILFFLDDLLQEN